MRIKFRGAAYHVTSRGDRREMTCRDDEDRSGQLATMASFMGRFDARVLDYCLMGNRFHRALHTRLPATA